MRASQEARLGVEEVGAVRPCAEVGAAGAGVGAIPASVGAVGDGAAADGDSDGVGIGASTGALGWTGAGRTGIARIGATAIRRTCIRIIEQEIRNEVPVVFRLLARRSRGRSGCRQMVASRRRMPVTFFTHQPANRIHRSPILFYFACPLFRETDGGSHFLVDNLLDDRHQATLF